MVVMAKNIQICTEIHINTWGRMPATYPSSICGTLTPQLLSPEKLSRCLCCEQCNVTGEIN